MKKRQKTAFDFSRNIIDFFNNQALTNFYIVILAFLVIGFLILRSVADFVPTLYSDNAIYSHIVWYFTQGQIDKAIHMWWQPLYPLMGSIFYLYFKDIALSLFYVSVFFQILLFTPVFFLTFELTKNRLVSVFAGILATFHVQLLTSVYALLTENMYITLLMACVLFATLSLSRKKLVYAFFYGLILGITYIARSDILLSYQIYLLLGIILVLARQIPKSFYFKAVGISLLAFFIAASPYFYFNYLKFGYLNLGAKINAVKNMPAYFSPQKGFTTTFAQDVWALEDPNYDSDFFNKPFDYWRYRIELWESSVNRFWGYFRLFIERENIISVYIYVAGFFVSIFYFLKYLKAGLYINLLAVLGFLISLIFQPGVDFRYALWLYPLFSIFTSLLILALNKLVIFSFKKIGNNNLKINAAKFTVLAFLNLAFVIFYFDLYKNNLNPRPMVGDTKSIHEITGEHIKSLKPHARVMTRRESIVYYAKGSVVYIPSSINIDELKSYAKLYRPDFIVADRDTFPPDSLLGFLNDERKSPDWLIPVRIWTEKYPKTIIYMVEI